MWTWQDGAAEADAVPHGRPQRWVPLEPVAFLESTWNLVLVLGYTEQLGSKNWKKSCRQHSFKGWRPDRAVGRFIILCRYNVLLQFNRVAVVQTSTCVRFGADLHRCTSPRSGWLDVLIACLMLLVSAGLQITFSIILLSKDAHRFGMISC